MPRRARITHDVVCEFLAYDPLTGGLTWKPRDRHWFRSDKAWQSWNDRFAGTPAFCSPDEEYFSGCIFRINVRAHQIIFFYMHGRWADPEVDHINRNGRDNRWVNLREADRPKNAMNSKLYSTNTSGFKGVSPAKNKKWQATIGVQNRKIHLGFFDKPEAAYSAYCDAVRKYHPSRCP